MLLGQLHIQRVLYLDRLTSKVTHETCPLFGQIDIEGVLIAAAVGNVLDLKAKLGWFEVGDPRQPHLRRTLHVNEPTTHVKTTRVKHDTNRRNVQASHIANIAPYS